MRRTRRNHASGFKAKIAIAALKCDKTLAELAEPDLKVLHAKISQLTLENDFLESALYRKPSTRKRHQAHPVYPYLLRNLSIIHSNHAWAADITYIPMEAWFPPSICSL